MASTVKQNLIEDIRQNASQGSPSTNWYLLATDLIPLRVTKKYTQKSSSNNAQTET